MTSINQPTIIPPQPPAPPKRKKHGLTYQNACVNVALNERQYLFLFDVAVRAYATVAVLKLLQPWFGELTDVGIDDTCRVVDFDFDLKFNQMCRITYVCLFFGSDR